MPDLDSVASEDPVTPAEWALENARHRSLGELYPNVRSAAELTVDGDVALPTRIRNVLLRWLGLRWKPYLNKTVGEFLDRRNSGRLTVLEILRRAEAIEHLARANSGIFPSPSAVGDDNTSNKTLEEIPIRSAREAEIASAVAAIALWARGELGIDQFPVAVGAAVANGPPEIERALHFLTECDWVSLAPEIGRSFDVLAQLQTVWLQFDRRERTVFLRRMAPVRASAITLEQLGKDFGIARERVRQIEAKVARNLRRAELHSSAVSRAATRVGAELGAAIPLERALEIPTWRSFGIEDIGVPEAGILMWLGGPYEVVGGWLIRAPARKFVLHTESVVTAATRSGAVPVEHVVDELRALGIHDAHAREWLVSLGGIRVRDDHVVRWSGSLADKAEAVARRSSAGRG